MDWLEVVGGLVGGSGWIGWRWWVVGGGWIGWR